MIAYSSPSRTVVDRRYLVSERLGVGGTAVVYCAEDLLLGRKVVLKVLHEWLADDHETIARFQREAASLAYLRHPNIVSAYGSGEWNGMPYIVLEYVPGRTLRSLVQEAAPLAPARAIDLTTQLVRATRYIHQHGIVHRDLKPDNVLVDSDGQLKLTDFGIARPPESDLTQTGNIIGTAHYMSPEQAQGHVAGLASDLYSLGVILFELLTGRTPFVANTAMAILFKHVTELPARPSEFNPAVPWSLDEIALRALEKQPADRFPDADAFIDALARAGRHLPDEIAASAVPGELGRRASWKIRTPEADLPRSSR